MANGGGRILVGGKLVRCCFCWNGNAWIQEAQCFPCLTPNGICLTAGAGAAQQTGVAAGPFGMPLSINPSQFVQSTNYGAPLALSTANLIFTDYFGIPLSAPFNPVLEGFGSPLAISGTNNLVQPVTIGGNHLIHYGDEARLFVDSLIIGGVITPANINTGWMASSVKRNVIEHIASGSLQLEDSYAYNFNSSATGPVRITLPSGQNGIVYSFARTSNHGFEIQTQDNERIIFSSGSIAGILGLDTLTASVELIRHSNKWYAYKEKNVRQVLAFNLTPQVVPSGVPNLALHLDASDSSTITLDGSNNVSQWDDKSINGYAFTQATTSRRPSMESGVVNGLDVMLYDDVNLENLELALSVVSVAPFSVYYVASLDDTTGSSKAVFAVADNTENDDGYLFYSDPTENPSVFINDISTASSIHSSFVIELNKEYIATFKEETDSSRTVKANGDILNQASGVVTQNLLGLNETKIGSDATLAEGAYWSGRIMEVVAYSGILTPVQEQGLINYFASKWGIAI